MASTRLRKAFHYPSEEDDADSPDELDEEHQEALIETLQTQDAQKNALYRTLFLAIPLLSTLFFLYTFISANTARKRLVSILAISSTSCTAVQDLPKSILA